MLANFIISTAFILSLFQGTLAASPSSNVFKPSLDAQPLFPLGKRALGLEARDILRRFLHPQTEIVLSYGEGFRPSQQQVFIVDVTLVYDLAAVLLLEDFEDLISSITCSTDQITITFFDNSDFDYAKDVWSAPEGFVLISNHPASNCNPNHERGAYMVKGVRWDRPKSTVEFLTESLALPSMAKRISVDFGHITQEYFHKTLTRRQTTQQDIEADDKDTLTNFHPNSTISLNTTFPSRAVLWPLSSDVEFGGGDNSESQLDVQITCVDCFINGELTYRGHFDVDLNGLDLELQWAYVEVEVTKAIKTQLNLEFYLALEGKQWEISLLPAPIVFSPFQIPGLLQLGPEFDYSLVTALSLGNTEFNFTYGVIVDVPVNSIAIFDFKQTNNSYSRGWDKTDVKQIPFFINSLDGDLALSINVTTQPSVGFKVTILAGDVSAGPSIDFAAPTLLVAADELHNVTANCSALGPDDYEYYENAFRFSTTWELGVSISVKAEVDIPLLPALGASFSKDLYTHSFPPDLTCRVLGNGIKTGELKPASSVTPQIDIAKVQSVVDRTGALPTGANPDLLANYTAASSLPTSIKNAIKASTKKGAANFQDMGRVGMLSVIISMAALAMII